MLYRIWTENKNEHKVLGLCTKAFDSFSVLNCTGCYKGQQELSICIEVSCDWGQSGETYRKIKELARKIKKLNNQESVLIQCLEVSQEFI